MKTLSVCCISTTFLAFVVPAFAQPDVTLPDNLPADAVVKLNMAFRPENKGFSEELMNQLSLPDGFAINVFAKDLGNSRILITDDDGTVYVSCMKEGVVKALRDTTGDGVADEVAMVFEGLRLVHGLVLDADAMLLIAPTTVWRAARDGNGGFAEPEVVIDDLPDGGQHPNRTAAFGPDGLLYISIGSTCNACEEPNPEHATMLTVGPDGRRRVFAEGLRNTVGFDWHPVSRELWGMDHGSDGRGADIPPEELNHIQAGKHYGWPWAYGDREVDPIIGDPQMKDMTKEELAKQTEPMVLGYQAHSAPLEMVFYTGDQFPERYRNGAFVAFRGSWNRAPSVGYKVAFIPFDANNRPTEFEDFVTGFLVDDGKGHFARLCGLTIARDGALLVSDDTNGVVYRISYTG
jgi:glucose/arabinose dehydrogenase